MAGYRGKRACRLGALGLAAAAVLAAGCGSSRPGNVERGHASGTVIVLAAASLKSAFDAIGKDFEKANPNVTVKFSYGGSSALATSIKHGASADVFASASTKNMDTVSSDRLTASTPQIFVRNKLEIMTEAGNPLHIKSVGDLAKPSVKVAVCSPAVPCGSYSKQVFEKAGVTVKPVSEETSVSGVVTKVSLGKADAGVVYVTDVKAGGDTVTGVPIPAKDNVVADYPIARLSGAPNKTGASAFVRYVLGTQGQKVLESYGFIPANH
jgi:molybdate transport system substrate-binding protein